MRITSVGVPPYSGDLGTQPASSDNCTSEPLPADHSCSFSTSLGVYAGGIARVNGSTKNLRGECTVYNDNTDVGVLIIPMR